MGDGNRTSRDRNEKSRTGDRESQKDARRSPGVELRESTEAGGRDGEDSAIEEVPPEVRDVVDGLSEAELRGVLQYVNAKLTADESKTTEPATSEGTGSQSESVEEQPEGVPPKATRVVKKINGNRYYYWQWRDGDSVMSKYDSPVDSG